MNSIDDDSMSDDDEYAFTLRMLIDSGSSTNVIDKGTWKELNSRRSSANLESAKRSCMLMAVVCL